MSICHTLLESQLHSILNNGLTTSTPTQLGTLHGYEVATSLFQTSLISLIGKQLTLQWAHTLSLDSHELISWNYKLHSHNYTTSLSRTNQNANYFECKQLMYVFMLFQ